MVEMAGEGKPNPNPNPNPETAAEKRERRRAAIEAVKREAKLRRGTALSPAPRVKRIVSSLSF